MINKPSLPPVPAALADVAFIDGPTCAAASGISLSSWHELVRLGQAPQPVIRQPRFTRWQVAQVRAFLIERPSMLAPNVAAAVTDQAKSASIRARTPEAIAKAKATRARNIAARIQPAAL